jgi:glycerophosphoryl diester phosphodiesterase
VHWAIHLYVVWGMSFKRIVIWLALFILTACQRDKPFDQIKIYGHAATGLENPSSVYHNNSLEAINLALSLEGCDGVELDVQMAADGSIWLYHDTELYTQTNASGCISTLDSIQLSQVRYSTFHKEKLTPLAQLDTVYLKNKSIFLDIRHASTCGNSILNVHQFIEELSCLGYNNSSSFETYVLTSFDQWIEPFSNAGFTCFFSAVDAVEANQKIKDFEMLDGVVVRNSDVQSTNVAEWIKKGKKVYIYEVRSPKGIRRAFNKFPSGILTDDLGNALIEKY